MQCQNIIPALNAWADQVLYSTACPIATQFPGHGCMNDLSTECSIDSQATWVIDVLGLFYNQAVADVWSTGAGIKCLYYMILTT